MNSFNQAIDFVLKNKSVNGIGTLKEKTVHAVLKKYYEPDESSHEVKIGDYVADIVGEDGIIEIQSKSFYLMQKKLKDFLQVANVTIVYPVYAKKIICASSSRISPKKERPLNIFTELYSIKNFINCNNLHFKIAVLEINEYRDNKGNKLDRVPTKLIKEIDLYSANSLLELIPAELPKHFTSSDIAKICKVSKNHAFTIISVLKEVALIKKIGKDGRYDLYEKC